MIVALSFLRRENSLRVSRGIAINELSERDCGGGGWT